MPDEHMKELFAYVQQRANIKAQPIVMPDIRGIEIVERVLGNRRVYFLFNLTDQTVSFDLMEKMSDYQDGSVYEGKVSVCARSYKILLDEGTGQQS